jgi:glutamine amidotransferase
VKVTLLDYGMGNLRSVTRALEAAGTEVERRTHPGDGPLVLPGVGAFAEACRRLRAQGAWERVAEALRRERPVLGICLGMQLLFEASEEHGENDGFGVFEGRVRHLGEGLTVPNMGWHRLALAVGGEGRGHGPVAAGLDGLWAYFAHSFGVRGSTSAIASIEHGGALVAAARRGSATGFQFHPEKSGAPGIALLRAWLAEAA